MLKIIAIADVDLLLSLGDLYDVTIEKAVDVYAPEHVFAVRGNHCVDTLFTAPTVDLHLQRLECLGLSLGGFAGSWRYKSHGNHMYTQEQEHALLTDFPAVDIFIAHNSPHGIREKDSHNHQGFDAFLDYIDRAQPSEDNGVRLTQLLDNISKKWTMPLRDWKPALNRFEDRCLCSN